MFALLSLLTGLAPAFAQITGDITNLKIAQAQAQTNEERARIGGLIGEAHDRRDAIIAEAGSRINAIIRAALAFPTVILLWKLEVYDKALGQWTGGHTDPLGDNLWKVIVAVIAFYFLYDMTARFRR